MANPVPDGPRPILTGKQTATKPVRTIKIKPSSDGQFYFVVTSRNGEPVYTSETYKRRPACIAAARREHEGRTNFDYVLQHDGPQGTVTETL